MTKKLNLEKVGFFDPEYESNGLVINVEKNVFYWDEFAFVNCLQDME